MIETQFVNAKDKILSNRDKEHSTDKDRDVIPNDATDSKWTSDPSSEHKAWTSCYSP